MYKHKPTQMSKKEQSDYNEWRKSKEFTKDLDTDIKSDWYKKDYFDECYNSGNLDFNYDGLVYNYGAIGIATEEQQKKGFKKYFCYVSNLDFDSNNLEEVERFLWDEWVKYESNYKRNQEDTPIHTIS
jgi:mRNA-degrading endonuclease YafQ of YafQ-DinJ toxin-antitoxin module